MAQPQGLCSKCLQTGNLTRHHIYPQRFFDDCDEVVYLCRACHDILEFIISKIEEKNSRKRIKRRKRLDKEKYLLIVINFIKGGRHV